MNPYHPGKYEEESEETALSNAIDASIVMHRDAHFGGEFDVMLEYYLQEGKGANPDFEIKRIKELDLIEKEMQQNLAGVLLTGADAEKIAKARGVYQQLRDLYEIENPVSKIPLLIADLIFSETEDAEEEIRAIVQEKEAALPALIELIRSEEFYDPLFPGYGLAPRLAVKCLGFIGGKRALITLFESIGSGDFFDEEVAIQSLHALGEPAKDFLLKVLCGRPLNIDNEKAAIALIAFRNDPEVGRRCLQMLHESDVLKDLPLSTYLILGCEGLQDEKDRDSFQDLYKDPRTPSFLKQDIKAIAKLWGRRIS